LHRKAILAFSVRYKIDYMSEAIITFSDLLHLSGYKNQNT